MDIFERDGIRYEIKKGTCRSCDLYNRSGCEWGEESHCACEKGYCYHETKGEENDKS